MPLFVVTEATSRVEFDAIVEVEWAANHNPFRPELAWMHPVYGHTEEQRRASMRLDADRRWESHINDPSSHWFFATDTADGTVVGAMEWQIHTDTPFPDGPPKLECDWFPPGETRDFVTNILNQCYYPRMHWMNRPHISANGLAVLPKMRGCGIASLLMRWGLEKANELNLECFFEATDLGKDVMERFGFHFLLTAMVNTYRKNASQTWTRLQSQLPPAAINLMWRPSPRDLNDASITSFWDKVGNVAPLKSKI